VRGTLVFAADVLRKGRRDEAAGVVYKIVEQRLRPKLGNLICPLSSHCPVSQHISLASTNPDHFVWTRSLSSDTPDKNQVVSLYLSIS